MVFSKASAMQIMWVLHSFSVSIALGGGSKEHYTDKSGGLEGLPLLCPFHILCMVFTIASAMISVKSLNALWCTSLVPAYPL